MPSFVRTKPKKTGYPFLFYVKEIFVDVKPLFGEKNFQKLRSTLHASGHKGRCAPVEHPKTTNLNFGFAVLLLCH